VTYSTSSNRFENASAYDLLSPDPSLSPPVFAFLENDGPFAIPKITPFCASDDCQWPPFDTLGVCSECSDVSSMLQFDCLREDGFWRGDWVTTNGWNTSTSLTSCGYFFNATSSRPMLMSGYATNSSQNGAVAGEALVLRQLDLRDPRTEEVYWDHSINFKNVPSPIIDFITVAVPDASAAWQNQTPIAQECVLRWCTKTIAARYYKGNYTEQIISTFTNNTMIPYPLAFNASNDGYEYRANITIIPPGQDRIFTVPNTTVLQTIFTFDFMVPAYVTQLNYSSSAYLRSRNDANVSSEARLAVYQGNQWALPNNVSLHLADLATAMTNVIREYPTSSELVYGSGSLEVFVLVSWGWFLLPVVLLLSTFIFLVATIVRSRKQAEIGIWKTSSLAALANGLDDRTKRTIESQTLLDLFDKSCDTEVFLRSEKGMLRLSLV
jgi:hypothetical protein